MAVPLGIISAQLFYNSKAFIEAAEILRREKQSGQPIYFLYSHALELAVKAYLASQGVSPERFQHDIQKAFTKAVDLGLKVDHPHAPAVVRAVSAFHTAMIFRYPANKQGEALNIVRAVLRTDQLAECVTAIWQAIEPHSIRARLRAASEGEQYAVVEWSMGRPEDDTPAQ
jgi:hypothetical protein